MFDLNLLNKKCICIVEDKAFPLGWTVGKFKCFERGAIAFKNLDYLYKPDDILLIGFKDCGSFKVLYKRDDFGFSPDGRSIFISNSL